MHSIVEDEESSGGACLTFKCGGGEHEIVAKSMGYELTPYFWGSLLEYLAPEVTEVVYFSSHDDVFEAHGGRDVVELLQEELEPYLEDPHMLEELLDEAYSNGYEILAR